MTEKTSPWCKALVAAVGTASATSTLLAIALTRTAWFRDHDVGDWHVRGVMAGLVLFPLSILLFALGVQWLIARRRALAVLGIVPLVAWIACLHLTRLEVPPGRPPGTPPDLTNANLLVNDTWLSLVLMQMQNLQPFGPGPA